jgi:hypothetical protein
MRQIVTPTAGRAAGAELFPKEAKHSSFVSGGEKIQVTSEVRPVFQSLNHNDRAIRELKFAADCFERLKSLTNSPALRGDCPASSFRHTEVSGRRCDFFQWRQDAQENMMLIEQRKKIIKFLLIHLRD